MNIQCVIILPSGEGGVLLLAAAVSVIAAELRVGQGGNLLLKNLNLHGNKKIIYWIKGWREGIGTLWMSVWYSDLIKWTTLLVSCNSEAPGWLNANWPSHRSYSSSPPTDRTVVILLQSRLLFIASFNVVVRLASQQRTREITRANKSSINKEEQSLCPKIRNGLDRWMARSRLAAFCPSATVKGAGRRTVCYSGSITASVSIRPDHAQTKAASRHKNKRDWPTTTTKYGDAFT